MARSAHRPAPHPGRWCRAVRPAHRAASGRGPARARPARRPRAAARPRSRRSGRESAAPVAPSRHWRGGPTPPRLAATRPLPAAARPAPAPGRNRRTARSCATSRPGRSAPDRRRRRPRGSSRAGWEPWFARAAAPAAPDTHEAGCARTHRSSAWVTP